MIRRLSYRLLPLLLLFAGFASAAGSERVVPTELCRDLWIVPIRFGDGPERTLRMVFDTGASKTSVDPDAIERVIGKRVATGKKVRLRGGRAGPLRIDRLRAQVHELDHIARALGTELDGILGFPSLKPMLVVLDYPAGEMRVGDGVLPEPDGRTVFADIGKVRPYLPLEIGGARLPLLIDSGFTKGLKLRPGDPIVWKVEPRPVGASARYDEIVVDRAGRGLEPVRVGPALLERPVIHLSDGTRLLGAEIMKHFVWTFDQRRRRLRIEPADGGESIDSPALRGLGMAMRPGENGFEILRVFDGGPAERAGLAVGDRVVAIDGRPVSERGCRTVAGAEGDGPVVLGVVDADGAREVEVEVVDLVP